MTIHEIETTLSTLKSRHANLDEALLVTLLRAGGWDEKTIRDAILVFQGSPPSVEGSTSIALPHQDVLNLPETVDNDHLLVQENSKAVDGVDISSVTLESGTAPVSVVEEEMHKEPESLIVPVASETIRHDDELPHNLPLRPFESMPHVWPFSRYKDVFHGDVMPETKEEAIQKLQTQIEEPQKTPVKEKIIEKHVVIEHVHIKQVPLSKKDEKLIVLAATMLLIILILLAYMYSNGRL